MPAATADTTSRPLGAMLESAIREERRGQPGSENVVLSELMLVEATRRYLVDLPGAQRRLAGLRDPIVARALEAMHGARSAVRVPIEVRHGP